MRIGKEMNQFSVPGRAPNDIRWIWLPYGIFEGKSRIQAQKAKLKKSQWSLSANTLRCTTHLLIVCMPHCRVDKLSSNQPAHFVADLRDNRKLNPHTEYYRKRIL